MEQNSRGKGILLALLGASMWGASGASGQFILQNCQFDTGWLVDTRMLLAGMILLIIDAAGHHGDIFSIWKDKTRAKDLILFGVVGLLAVQYTYFASIRAGNAAAATVLQYLMPVVLIAWSVLIRHERLRPVEILCVILAVGGTFLLVTHGSLTSLVIPLPAVLWGLGSAFAAAYYTVKPRNLIREWRAPLVVGWGMFIGGVAFLPFAPPWAFSGIWNLQAGLAYAFIIFFGTVVAFGCYLGSLAYLKPSETGSLGSAEPLTAIILSVAFLGVSFGIIDAVGVAMILGTVFLLSR